MSNGIIKRSEITKLETGMPSVAANKGALQEFPKVFICIEFAIYGSTSGSKKL